MVRIRAYSLVLSLPLLLALIGIIWFTVANSGREMIGRLLDHFPPAECANYPRNSGYAAT